MLEAATIGARSGNKSGVHHSAVSFTELDLFKVQGVRVTVLHQHAHSQTA